MMYYKFDSRLIIQKKGGNKYYFHVVSATTDHIYPFSIPVASIEVIANSGKLDYLTIVRFDDIVRYQVSVQYSPNERAVWQDLFEGRVLTIRAQYGSGSTATIICSGHAAETSYAILSEATTYASATDLASIINHYSFTYLNRTQVLLLEGTGITAPYSTKINQKYVKDIFLDFEKLSGYSWAFIARPTYDAQHNLITPCPIEFKPFSTVPTDKYKAIQGTPRLLSADFTSDGQNVYTKIVEYGKTPDAIAPATEGVQYTGTAIDSAAVALYGTRTLVETDTGLESNALCARFAEYYLPHIKSPRVAGSVTLEGTPQACIGDRVTTKIPMIDINGEPLDPNYPVLRVHHEVSYDSFETTLTLGETVEKDSEDYLVEFARKNRLVLSNFIT